MIDSFINSLGQQTPTFDPFAGMREVLVGFAVWVIIILVIIVAVQVVSAIIRFRAQQATISMQKDVKAIREMLEKQQSPAEVTQVSPVAENQN